MYDPLLAKLPSLDCGASSCHQCLDGGLPCRLDRRGVYVVGADRVHQRRPTFANGNCIIGQTSGNHGQESSAPAGWFDDHLIRNAGARHIAGHVENQVDNPFFRIDNTVVRRCHNPPEIRYSSVSPIRNRQRVSARPVKRCSQLTKHRNPQHHFRGREAIP